MRLLLLIFFVCIAYPICAQNLNAGGLLKAMAAPDRREFKKYMKGQGFIKGGHTTKTRIYCDYIFTDTKPEYTGIEYYRLDSCRIDLFVYGLEQSKYDFLMAEFKTFGFVYDKKASDKVQSIYLASEYPMFRLSPYKTTGKKDAFLLSYYLSPAFCDKNIVW